VNGKLPVEPGYALTSTAGLPTVVLFKRGCLAGECLAGSVFRGCLVSVSRACGRGVAFVPCVEPLFCRRQSLEVSHPL
jgi:hypothetical protein